MPLKLKKRCETLPSKENQNTDIVRTPSYAEFIKLWYANCNQRDIFGFIREWYEKCFNVFPPEKPMELLKLKIEYELLYRDFLIAEKLLKKTNPDYKIPQNVINNWEASRDFNVAKLKGVTKGYTEHQIKLQGVEKMVQAKKKVEKKEAKALPKLTVTGEYEGLFRNNNLGKLNDKQLAQAMCKQFPNKKAYTEEDIKTVRGMYNRGKLSTQKGVVPQEKSIAYTGLEKGKVIVAPAQKVTKKKVVLKKK